MTREKGNADYEVVGTRAVQASEHPLRTRPSSLEVVTRSGAIPSGSGGSRCGRGKGENLVLTNHFFFGPTTIAAAYKDHWQIEIFFKTIKQNLKIKIFSSGPLRTL